MNKIVWKYFLGSIAVILLSACANSERAEIDIACPQVGIMQDLSTMRYHINGDKNNPSALVVRTTIADYAGECEYKKRSVDTELKLSITVERGPQLKKDIVKVKYFVAIADPHRNIIQKSIYETDIHFKKNQTMAGSLETLTQSIPLQPSEGAGGYEILFGFQPDDAIKQFNESQ